MSGASLARMICCWPVRRRAVDITLVTANTREFERVDGLMWEDWSRALPR